MTHPPFLTFLESLLGDWVGRRRTATLDHELVRSRWRRTLDGRFLHEDWLTAASGESLDPTAEALFSVSDTGPGDFITAYKSGKIAFGESEFTDSTWTLTHRWLREPGVAVIRLRFLDANTYEQAVAAVTADGSHESESVAIMTRESGA